MDVSVGVFAFNEEGSISALLDALLKQNLREHRLAELIVVSFGSTDATNSIVAGKARRHPCVRLEKSPVCLGKAASVAHFLALAKSELLVLLSGDSELRSPDTVYRLLQRLLYEPGAGIIGARHRVSNPGTGFVAFAGERVWSTLDLVSCVEPKISGDLMAMRAGIADSIPGGVLNDDAYLEMCCQQRGLRKVYCRDAEVFIRIPENLKEYVSQRRRIYGGHRQLRRLFPEYRLSTTRLPLLFRLLLRQVTSVRTFFYTILLIFIDAAIRAQAQLDDLPRRYQGGRWPVIFTTKHKSAHSPGLTGGAG